MNEMLLKEKVTGEVLRRYDNIIKGWVNDQIKRIELAADLVTTEQAEILIQEALSSFSGGLTEEEVRQIVVEILAESGSGGEPEIIPEWIGQIVFVNSPTNCRNASDVNGLIWPGQDFSSKNDHSAMAFFGKTSGLRLITRNPGGASSETEVVRIFVDELVKLTVRYDEFGTWVDVDSFEGRYSFCSLDSNQEYFEYASDNKIYHVDYSDLPTTSDVQSIVDLATGSSLTEERVQEMIDASVGAALADYY